MVYTRQIHCQSQPYCSHPYCPVRVTCFTSYLKPSWARIAQSVMLLCTGWTFRGSNPGWEAIFPASVQTGSGVHPASYTMGSGSFPGLKRPERGVDHPFSAVVKEREQVYLYSPTRPSWPVLGWSLPLPLPWSHDKSQVSFLDNQRYCLQCDSNSVEYSHYVVQGLLNVSRTVTVLVTWRSDAATSPRIFYWHQSLWKL